MKIKSIRDCEPTEQALFRFAFWDYYGGIAEKMLKSKKRFVINACRKSGKATFIKNMQKKGLM